MNDFLKKTIIFFLCFSVIYGGLYVISFKSKYEQNDYITAIVNKHNRANSIAGQKALIIAGSNIAFGIDSKIIEDSIAIPVTNLGITGGLGAEFILNEAKALLKPNDIAILSLEYLVTLEGDYQNKYKARTALPEASNYFTKDLNAELIIANYNMRNRLIHFNSKSTSNQSPIYNLKYFNSRGDLTSHHGKAQIESLISNSGPVYNTFEVVDCIEAFSAYCKANNIKLLYEYPSLAQLGYNKYKSYIDQFVAKLHKIENIEFIGTFSSSVKPDSCFYDSIFHLLENEKVKRSKVLGSALKQLLN